MPPGSTSRPSVAVLLLAMLLFLAPLPAGGVTPAGQLVFRLVGWTILALAVYLPGVRFGRRQLLAAAALAAIGLLGLCQSCRWPTPAARLLSPQHVELHEQAAALVDEPPRVYLSVEPWGSRSAALSWLTVAALLAAAQGLGRSARNRRLLAAAILLAAVVQAAVSVLFPDPGIDLATDLLRPEGRLRGSFANPNHLALFCEIGMAVALAWIWWGSGGRAMRPARRVILWLPAVLVWLSLFALVILTGSRAGLLAAVVGTLVQVTVILWSTRRRQLLGVGLALLLGLGALLAVGSVVEIKRYTSVSVFEDNLRSRLEMVGPMLELWRQFPVTGTGLGTFEDAFPMVAPSQLSRILWNRAHNNWLELLVTGGLVAFALAAVAAVALLTGIRKAWRDGRRVEDRAAALAAAGAMAAAGVHELFDFGLVIPANAAALIVVLGAAVTVPLIRPEPAEG